jgi:poly-beta-1,6-N-acetyl-D-glucosamine synthase
MHWLPVILILPYLFMLLRIYTGLRRIKNFEISSEPDLFVSVVVACRNEQKNLPLLLESLANQDYPAGLYEILVVDDNSSDNTYETAARFSTSCKIIALHNKGTGKKQALRTGIEKSAGELILTTDADCIPTRKWIRTIACFYNVSKPDMIISPVLMNRGSGFQESFGEIEFMSLQGITAGTALLKRPVMCNGANLAFRKDAYFRHSGNLHDEINSGDDIFLLHSLKKEKLSVIRWLESEDAIVRTPSPATFRAIILQRSRWISKWKYYTDWYTIILAIVTFVTILLQIGLIAAVIIDSAFAGPVIAVLLLKSIPDFLILKNVTLRYKKPQLMKWFIPAYLIYPLYVFLVTSGLIRR